MSSSFNVHKPISRDFCARIKDLVDGIATSYVPVMANVVRYFGTSLQASLQFIASRFSTGLNYFAKRKRNYFSGFWNYFQDNWRCTFTHSGENVTDINILDAADDYLQNQINLNNLGTLDCLFFLYSIPTLL